MDLVGAVADRTVMVTGATSGLGLAAAHGFARAGARLHIVARDPHRAEEARASIIERSGNENVHMHLADLSRPGQVRALADTFERHHGLLDILVNNAGVLPTERQRTPEGFELAFATNVLSPFLLTNLLVPALSRARPSRIITVTSGGMYTRRLDVEDLQLERREFDGPTFYAHTKRAEVILTELWAERLASLGITAHAMHPGWADTPGLASSMPRFHRLIRPLLRDAQQGADTILWLAAASEPADRPGELWHDRAWRPKHRVPWTRESAGERDRLWNELVRASGLSEQSLAEAEDAAPPQSVPTNVDYPTTHPPRNVREGEPWPAIAQQ